jgi:hypothetical protein
MTLKPFPPNELDSLALRLLDISASVRRMSLVSQQHAIGDFRLHGNKVDEWLDNLELWVDEGLARLETIAIRHRGRRAAVAQGARAAKEAPQKRRRSTRSGR